MEYLTTKGEDWIQPSPQSARILNRYARVIVGLQDIDLSQKGGYAIKSPFSRLDQMVALGEAQFMVVAHQRFRKVAGYADDQNRADVEVPGGHSTWYEVVLVRAHHEELSVVGDEQMRQAVANSDVLSPQCVNKAEASTFYRIAAYAYDIIYAHDRAVSGAGNQKKDTEPKDKPPVRRRRRRRFVMLNMEQDDED